MGRNSATSTINKNRDKPPVQQRSAVMAAAVLELAKRRNFADVLELFAENPKAIDLDCWLLDEDGGTILHRVVALRPPVTLVDLIVSRMMACRPNTVPEDTTDKHGRTPLHIAAASDADVSVISRLTNGTVLSSPALSMDYQHRLPLHWACTNPNGQRRALFAACGAHYKAKHNMLRIVEILVDFYPHAVWARDQEGKTPYELAVANRADWRMLALLRGTMRSFHPGGYGAGVMDKTRLTDATSEFPAGVSEVTEYDCDFDEVSSMGSGGISTIHPPPRIKANKSRDFAQVAL